MREQTRKTFHKLIDRALDEHPDAIGILMVIEVEVTPGERPTRALLLKGILNQEALRLRELIAQLRQDQPAEEG